MPARQLELTRTLRQDFPFIGAMLKEERTQGGQLLARISNTWDKAESVAGKVVFPYLAASNEEQFEDGSAVSANSTSQSFDSQYGNLLSSTTKVAANLGGLSAPLHTTSVTREYQNDDSDWLIGFVTGETHTTSAAGNSRTRRHSYTRAGNSLAQASETRFSALAGLERTTTYSRDGQGRVTGITTSGPGITSRTSSMESYQGPWPGIQRNALGHTTTTSYDWGSGKPSALTDANGLTSSYSYDGFGRELLLSNPDGSRQVTRYLSGNATPHCSSGAKSAVQLRMTNAAGTEQGAPERWQCLDSLGRVIRELHQGFDGNWVKVDSQYDALGHKVKQSEPYSQSPVFLQTTWDLQDRPQTQQLAGGASLSYSYGARNAGGRWRQYSLTYDQSGPQTRVERRESNALGQLLLSLNAAGSALQTSTQYAYDADGNLVWTQVNGSASTAIRMAYDLAGNRTSLNDPNSGQQQMRYDALGQLTELIASDGSKIVSQYDLLGRLLERSDIDASGTLLEGSRWAYDSAPHGVGELAGMGRTDQSFLQVYGYDALSRQNQRQTTISAARQNLTYIDGQHYDGFSRPVLTQDATGFSYSSHYNGYGYLIGERNQQDGQPLRVIGAQNSRGQNTQVSYGNGVVTRYDYDEATGWLEAISSATPQGFLQQLSYSYGQNGLLLAREDGRGLRESFDYDLLQRLTRSTRNLGGQVLQDDYRYDALGNLLQNPQFAELRYGQYDAAGQSACGGSVVPGPHAVVQSSAGYYCYDARGNQLSGPGREVSYSLYDKPLSIGSAGQYSSFSYDPERRRYLQVASNRITFYLDEGRFEEVIDNGQHKQNSYIGGYLQVQRDPSSNQFHLNYQLQDQLGSLESVTDASGALVEKRSYAAFGSVRGADWSNTPAPLLTTTRGFTDHEHLPEVGLIHMNGRVYDPALGRFLSADIVYQDTANAQMFNRYSYGFNSPFSYLDPTGYEAQPWFSTHFYGATDIFSGDRNVYNTGSSIVDGFGAAGGSVRNLLGFAGNAGLALVNFAPISLSAISGMSFREAESNIFALGMSLGPVTGSASRLLTLNSLRYSLASEAVVASSAEAALANLPNRFSGIQEASTYLKAEGVSRARRVQILQSFDADSVVVRKAGQQEYGLRYFDNKEAFADGRYLFETFPATRESLAVKSASYSSKTWNDMTYFQQWQIRPGATFIEGRAAPQGLGYSGGQIQKFILTPSTDYIKP